MFIKNKGLYYLAKETVNIKLKVMWRSHIKEHVFDTMFREPYVYQERGLPDQEVKKNMAPFIY